MGSADRATDVPGPLFEGQRIALLGRFPGGGRRHFKAFLEREGATVTRTVSTDTQVVLVGDGPASLGAMRDAECRSAEKAGPRTVPADQFARLLPLADEQWLELAAAGAAGKRRWAELVADPRTAPRIDWTGRDLRNRRLDGLDLRPVEMDGADLRGADLSRAAAAVLRDARLDQARLAGATVERLSNCSLAGAAAQLAELGDLVDCDLHQADLRHANFYTAQRCSLRHARLDDPDGQGFQAFETLVDCDLAHATMRGIHVPHCRFIRCSLRGTRLDGSTLTGALFDRCDLADATMDGADLTGSRWIGCDGIGTPRGGSAVRQ